MARNDKQPAGDAGSADASPTRLGEGTPSPTSAQQTQEDSSTLKYHLPQDLETSTVPAFLHATQAESRIWGPGNRRLFGPTDTAKEKAHQERVLDLCHEMAIQDPKLDDLKLPPGLVLREGRLDRPRPIGSRPRPVYILLRNLPATWTQNDLDMITFGFNVINHAELLPSEQSPDSGYRAALLTVLNDQATGEVRGRLQGKPAPGSDKAMELLIVDKINSADSSPSRRTPESNPESTSSESRHAMRAKYGTDQKFVDSFHNIYNELDIAERARDSYAASIRVAPHHVDAYAQRAAQEQDTPWPTRSFPSTTGTDQGFDVNSQRRATAPAIPPMPVELLRALTLETSYAHMRPQASASAHPGVTSPQSNGMPGPSNWNQPQQYHQQHHHQHQQYHHQPHHQQQHHPQQHRPPTANPADQNPPCNTLYVGNLPMNTSEEELKATFSKQRGYKRLCYRTKANGPMCFVEFDDTTCATRTLKLLYGHMLTNSTKGGIRLSFSKNPLGVRPPNHQSNNAHSNGFGSGSNGSTNGFRPAAGPPPGLAAPPGLAPPQQVNGHANGQNGAQLGQISHVNLQSGGQPGQNGYTNGYSNMASNVSSNGTSSGASNIISNDIPNGISNISNGASNGASNGPSNGASNGTSTGYNPNVYGSGGYSNGFNGFSPFLGNGYPNGRPWG